MTKRSSRMLLLYYLLGHGLTLVTLLCACIYLGYYLRLASVTDEFGCVLRVGMLATDPYIPEKVQCKLIAVGVFSLLRYFSVQCGLFVMPAYLLLFLDVIKCFSLIVPFSSYYKNYTFLLILFPASSTWSCLLHSFLWWSMPVCVPSSAMAMPTSWKSTSCCPLWVFCPPLVANGMISLCICYSWRRTSANSSPTNTSRCVGIKLPLRAALLVLVQIL